MRGRPATGRGRVGKLGADAHQVAGDGMEYCARGLYGDVKAAGAKALGKRDGLPRDHRFTSGQYDVAGGLVRVYALEDRVQGKVSAFGAPGRVGGVAPDATQVAPARAHEYRRHADKGAFTLDGIKNFGDFHASTIPASSKPLRRRTQESQAPHGRPAASGS